MRQGTLPDMPEAAADGAGGQRPCTITAWCARGDHAAGRCLRGPITVAVRKLELGGVQAALLEQSAVVCDRLAGTARAAQYWATVATKLEQLLPDSGDQPKRKLLAEVRSLAPSK